MRALLMIVKQFLRSPRAFLAKAREAGARLEQEQRVAAGVAPPQPVYDDLPNLGFRNVVVDRPPALDVLIPGLQKQHLSGGPNTALNLTYRVAAAGVPVRTSPPTCLTMTRSRCAGTAQGSPAWQNACRTSASPACATAPRPHPSVGETCPSPRRGGQPSTRSTCWVARDAFFYMIQDFEPGSARNSPRCVRSSPGCGAASHDAPPPL